jgi:hypothetical protein
MDGILGWDTGMGKDTWRFFYFWGLGVEIHYTLYTTLLKTRFLLV